MTSEHENTPVDPALNGDEPKPAEEGVSSVEPNGSDESNGRGAPEAAQIVPPAVEEMPAASEEQPESDALAAAEAPVAEPEPAPEQEAEREPQPAPEPAPVEDPVAEAARQPSERPTAPETAPEPPAEEVAAVESDSEPQATEPGAETSTIAADISSALAAAAATARASAEAAERAAAEVESPVAVATQEPPEEFVGEGEESGDGAEAVPAKGFQPGDWFVVHTYAGYENKVKANLQSRISSMNMEEKIFEVTIPMEDVMEIKSGKKQVVQRKVFPGYLLVRMDLDDDSWYVVRNTPGVTGFVGSGTRPIPLSEREVDRILQRKAVGERPKPKLEWTISDPVRVTTGPFANFQGVISEIDTDRSKLKVLVNIFGRETPVELGFDQVAKV